MKPTVQSILALTLIFPLANCDAEPDSTPGPALDDAELSDLAWRYLYEPLAVPDDAEPIFAQIRQLDDEQQRRFQELVIELQLEGTPLTDELRRELDFNRAVHEQRIARGLGMLDATEAEVEMVMDSVVSPVTPRAACSTATFNSTLTEQNYCALGAIAASSYDRRDNDPVAYPACDYRFRFATATKRFNVAGHNAATLCVLSHNNGSLLSSYSSGSQYALVGYNWMTWCNIVNTGTVATGLRIF